MSSPVRCTWEQKLISFYLKTTENTTFKILKSQLEDLTLTLAWPCLPVFEVVISTILQGRPFNMTKPFFLSAEHCMGNVVDAPASAVEKSSSAMMCHGLLNIMKQEPKKKPFIMMDKLKMHFLMINANGPLRIRHFNMNNLNFYIRKTLK